MEFSILRTWVSTFDFINNTSKIYWTQPSPFVPHPQSSSSVGSGSFPRLDPRKVGKGKVGVTVVYGTGKMK